MGDGQTTETFICQEYVLPYSVLVKHSVVCAMDKHTVHAASIGMTPIDYHMPSRYSNIRNEQPYPTVSVEYYSSSCE